ncbi:response regulator [Paenibacillus sp. V4I5]|uniref:response regulator n=1 Tax=Paenibacillus sp. V4I5 TaxID=3042306 RepID=UPI002790104D|nr:response regulator [Paenibacillus sp. V4I5]MDQ0919506.1 two-component SAPR family response regulator [Paenibacillus sp. V4I5]
MIRIVAVDDELPALRRVGKLLESFEEVQVCGLFDKSTVFLEYILTEPEPIDLVLLDMDMPTLHGLELARRLRECRPEIHIAFLTAYEEFAREAFDVEALDYLLKPVLKEDLSRMISRFLKRSRRDAEGENRPETGIVVNSFGPFTITMDNGVQIKFRNSKGKELLAYLHHHRGKPVSKAQIMEEIWYGRDVERTQVNLHSTIYQLRKDLETCGLSGLIVQTKIAGGSYSLNWSTFIYDDVVAYENEVNLFKRTLSLTHALRAVQHYGGGYLSGGGYGWAAPRQAELELSYAELLEAIVDTYVRQQRYDIALNPMRKWAELFPLSGRLHAKMIALLLLMNRDADARAYHELVRELLDRTEDLSEIDFVSLSVNPSALF